MTHPPDVSHGAVSKKNSISRKTVFRFVLLTVLATLVVWYIVAIFTFAGNTHSLNNRFTEVAVGQHWTYLIWSNIEVLKGYLVVGAVFTAIVYPVVLIWARFQSFKRWGVVWRALVICALFYGFFVFRLMLNKPYFGDFSYFDIGWHKFGQWFGHAIQQGFSYFVLAIFPALAVCVCVLFYLSELRRLLRHRAGFFTWSITATLAILAALAASGFGVISTNPTPIEEVPKARANPKNILILASDSLRADRLSCNGYHRPTSPNIDKIATEGINFTHCFTPTASTLESLTTMFSSQYPHTHGIQHMFPNKEQVSKANASMPALASILAAQGYDTAVIGDWCACGFNELPMGFQDITVSDFDNFKVYMSEVVYLHHQILPLFFDNRVGHWLFPKLKSFANFMTPEVVTNQVIDRLKTRDDDQKPFVLFAFYSCTHLPYKTPREYAELWSDPAYNGPHKHQLALNVDEFIGDVDIGEKWDKLPPNEVAQINALYDGNVRMFDDCVGRIMQALDASGLKENTVVIVTADHGDDLFEPNVTFGHGLTFNGGDQNNNIPLIVRVPGMEDNLVGRKVPNLVRSIDLPPTLLELVGQPVEPRFEGRSLVPYLQEVNADLSLAWYGETSYLFFRRKIPGEEPLHIPPMDETTMIDPEFDFHFVLKDKYQQDVLKTKERCLRTRRFKLVYTPGQHGPIHRLYDLPKDKHCEEDVKANYPQVFARMKSALHRWMENHQETSIKEIFPNQDEFQILPE
jgi:arylsulfatase A-like enzyme